MSLRIRRKSPFRLNSIATLMAVFALVVSPMYGVVSERVANAAGATNLVEVTPAGFSDSGWTFYNDALSGRSMSPGANYKIDVNPSYQKYGDDTGAVMVNAVGQKYNLSTASSMKLSEISHLSFDVNTTNPGRAYFNIDVDFGMNNFKKFNGRLIFVPAADANTWSSTGNAAESGTTWQWSQFSNNGNKWPDGNTNASRKWNEIVSSFPDAKVSTVSWLPKYIIFGPLTKFNTTGYIHLRSENTKSYFDNVRINDTEYNFELPVPAAPTNLRYTQEVVNDQYPSGKIMEYHDGEGYLNETSPTPRKSIGLKWDAPASANSYTEYVARGYYKDNHDPTLDQTVAQTYLGNSRVGSKGSGQYKFEVSTRDGATGIESAPAVASIVYDDQKPKISTFEFQGAKGGKYNPTKVVARATDTGGSFVTNVYINVYKKDSNGHWKQQGGTFEQANQSGRDFAEMDASYPLIKNDGTYMLKAWAKDRAGNTGEIEEGRSGEFVVDNTAPAKSDIKAKMTPALVGSSDTPELEVTASDSGSGIDYVQYSIRSADNAKELIGFTNVTGADSSDTFKGDVVFDRTKAPKPSLGIEEYFDSNLKLKDGKYILRVRAFDNAGNKTSGVDLDFTLDRTAPQVAITSIVSNGGGTYTVWGTTSDVYSQIDVTVGAVSRTVSADQSTGIWSVTFNPAGIPGLYQVSAISTDAAGNVSSAATDQFEVTRQDGGGQNNGASDGTPEQPGGSRFGPLRAPGFITPLGDLGTVLGDNIDTDSDADSADDAATGRTDGENRTDSERRGDVAGAADDKDGCYKLLGLCWYYWVPIVIVVAAIIVWRSLARREEPGVA